MGSPGFTKQLLILLVPSLCFGAMVVDYFPESFQTGQELIDSNSVNNSGIGQSFFGNGLTVTSVQFYLKKTGSPTGTANARIYAATGAADISLSGSVEKVTGSALAASDNFTVSGLTTSFALTTLTFSGANQIVLAANTRYIVTMEYASGSSGNSVIIGKKVWGAAPTFLGNASYKDAGHTGFDGLLSGDDVCFYVNGADIQTGGLYTNLYSYFRCEEVSGAAALDAVGGHHIIQASGSSAIGTTTGKVANARSFPGSGSTYFNQPYTATQWQFGATTFSFSFWVNITSYASADTGFVNKYINTPIGDQEFICYQAVTSHLLKLDVGNGSSVTSVSSGTAMSTGTWYFVAGGYDGTNVWISVNGGAKTTAALTGPIVTGTQFFTMGMELGSASPLNGVLDEVAFWSNRTLTAGEITSLYNSGKGLAMIPFVTDSGLTTTGDTSNVTSYTSASFTPAVGDLLVAFVSAPGTVATGTMTDSASLGFTKVTSALFSASAGTLYCFVANNLVTSATGTTVTFDCTGDAAVGAYIMVARVAGMTKTGSSAIKQSAKHENIGTASAPAPVFGASALATNVTLGAVANAAGPPATMTAPTGWVERADGGFGTPTTGGEYVSRDNGFSGTTVTWGSTVGGASQGGALIVELDTSVPVVATNTGAFFQMF